MKIARRNFAVCTTKIYWVVNEYPDLSFFKMERLNGGCKKTA
jgi:hypothetical protein